MNTGYQGELACAQALTARGWVVHWPAGGCTGHDLLIWKPELYRRVQIKATTGRHWKMSSKHELCSEPDLFFIFVRLPAEFWICPSSAVAAELKREHAEWLSAKPGRRTNSERIWRADEQFSARFDLLL